MKYYPILFNGEMVRAILEGRKGMTRRVMMPQPQSIDESTNRTVPYSGSNEFLQKSIKCPYGGPGDRLWVRETWAHIDDYTGSDPGCAALLSKCFYRADYGEIDNIHDELKKWKPSIHMPRWACRILLEVTDIRVERVQDIKLQDVTAEGVTPAGINKIQRQEGLSYPNALRWKFRTLWDSINEKRGFGWDVNPWVWVVGFKRVEV